jgi:hypothetical protein
MGTVILLGVLADGPLARRRLIPTVRTKAGANLAKPGVAAAP